MLLWQPPKIPAKPPHVGVELELGETESVGVGKPDWVWSGGFGELLADGEALGVGLLDTVMFEMFGCGNGLSPTNFDFVPCIIFMKSDQIASG